MKESKKIKTLPFLKFQTVMGGIFGLMTGIMYAFGGLIIDALVSANWIAHSETPGLSYGTILAFGALIGMPIIFAGFGLIIGIFEVLVFNGLSKWMDFLEINFEK